MQHLPACRWSHRRHLGQANDNEELANDDPSVAPEHASGAAIDKHLEVV